MKQLNDILEIFANRGSGADVNEAARGKYKSKLDKEIDDTIARVNAQRSGHKGASERFTHHEALIKQHLKDISNGIANMKSEAQKTTGIHYGHVGTMADHSEKLKDIADSLHNRGEYAPENVSRYEGKFTRKNPKD